jgi:hypothetical protein
MYGHVQGRGYLCASCLINDHRGVTHDVVRLQAKYRDDCARRVEDVRKSFTETAKELQHLATVVSNVIMARNSKIFRFYFQYRRKKITPISQLFLKSRAQNLKFLHSVF